MRYPMKQEAGGNGPCLQSLLCMVRYHGVDGEDDIAILATAVAIDLVNEEAKA